jgi:hypothetical protein
MKLIYDSSLFIVIESVKVIFELLFGDLEHVCRLANILLSFDNHFG